jgi:hypothetical protein
MLRPFTIAALAAIAVLMTAPRVGAGVLSPILGSPAWQQVVAKGAGSIPGDDDVYATAFHGYISGTEADGDGDPLLKYLNSGTDANEELQLQPGGTLFPSGTDFTISGDGMFGSTNTGIPNTNAPGFPVIDVVEFQSDFLGFERLPGQKWVFVGKTDQVETGGVNGGPFVSINNGTLALPANTKLQAGSYVLSLKAGNNYSVYLFENVGEISAFTYNIGRQDLSHTSLYRFDPGTGHVPEPASLAVFGFGALLGVGGLVRRRFPNRKGFALRVLAT